MVKDTTVYYYYKKNVPYYNVGVRRFLSDTDGVLLTNEFPTVRIAEEDLRDFKMSNKYAINQGLIVPVDEEPLEWDVPNAISDEEVTAILKNTMKLKKTLKDVNSLPVVQKILASAKDQGKSLAVTDLIEARLAELTPNEDAFIHRSDMGGSFDDTKGLEG